MLNFIYSYIYVQLCKELTPIPLYIFFVMYTAAHFKYLFYNELSCYNYYYYCMRICISS